MGRATSMFGLLAMEEVSLTLVQLMAMFQASTLLGLELLISSASRLNTMRNVHQRWL